MPEVVVATIEGEIASSNAETRGVKVFQMEEKRSFITRITALVAAPTGVAERWGRGTWRDIFVESSRRGIGIFSVEERRSRSRSSFNFSLTERKQQKKNDQQIELLVQVKSSRERDARRRIGQKGKAVELLLHDVC